VLKVVAKAEQQSALPTYINLTQDQIAFELQSDLTYGLSREEAAGRLTRYGHNLLRQTYRIPWYVKLTKNLFSFFAVLLWIAALLCFIPGVDLPQLGLAILTVVLINGLFAFLQEYKSDRALEMLQQLIAQRCRLIRDGKLSEIDARDLVPGDVIVLEEGDFVPADARFVRSVRSRSGQLVSHRRVHARTPLNPTNRLNLR
jgi:magnesium-transporting ATPase (P-type)